jgi:hypothetical protein
MLTGADAVTKNGCMQLDAAMANGNSNQRFGKQ